MVRKEREGPIVACKGKIPLSILAISLWLAATVSLYMGIRESILLWENSFYFKKELTKLDVFVYIFLGLFATHFYLTKTYRIDLAKGVLTIEDEIPFWKFTKSEAITSKKVLKVGPDKWAINSNSITVGINNEKIRLYTGLHPKDLERKLIYLKEAGFVLDCPEVLKKGLKDIG